VTAVVKVFRSDEHRRHDPRVGIEQSQLMPAFEHAARAEVIAATLAADARFVTCAPQPHGLAPVEAVHDAGLIRFLRDGWQEYQRACGPTADVMPDVFFRPALRRGMGEGREPESVLARLGWWCFETTTPLTAGTFTAACAAVDVALSAADAVLAGDRYAYGLCRPPGHHATSSLYGGYCYFNNAAIVAAHVVRATGSRVAVLDVDYHHGNGTQEIFYDRADVLYVSLHGDPARAYPWHTGHADETGTGRGAGANRNIPLPARLDDDGYLAALAQAVDAVAAFGPSLLVVSLGLDTFHRDPISDLALTEGGFERCGAAVAALGLPTLVLQEGGYDLATLGANARAWLLGLAR
jgi:acetoin utilization deacetylase AcuC-like enzyme